MDKVIYIAYELASVFGTRLLTQYSSKEIAEYWKKKNAKNAPTNE